MKTIAASAAKDLGHFMANDFRRGSSHAEAAKRLGPRARNTLECIGRSGAQYHDMEHILLVTRLAIWRLPNPAQAPARMSPA
jgi:hypothetical protein